MRGSGVSQDVPWFPAMASYITPEGFRKLQEEFEHLWKIVRPRVTHEVSVAAALGDRSYNADYIYGKKRLREIDRRLRFLSKRLDALTVVRSSPDQEGRVYFGAWVTLEDAKGDVTEYRLVGPDEFDVAAGKISIESPMGRSLMGKEEGDEFVLRRPKGPATFKVVAIRYTDEVGESG
jgi:transcription elongation factor GreB